MGIQQEQLNKRRRPSHDHDQDHQQGVDAGDLHKKKQARRVRLLVMEYTAEDVARFDEEMARANKRFDDFQANMASFDPASDLKPIVSFTSPCLQAPGPKEEEVVGGRRRVSKATIKNIRSFAERSGYHPFSERLLSNPRVFPPALADKFRIGDRIMSKLFAQAQARARKTLHHYDAKGYLEYTAHAHSTIDLSTPGH